MRVSKGIDSWPAPAVVQVIYPSRNIPMKSLFMLGAMLVGGLTLSHTAHAQLIPCSELSFSGKYIFKYDGHINGVGPYGAVGLFVVDGLGNGSAHKATIINGGAVEHATDPFTYDVESPSECEYTLRTTEGLQITIFLDPATRTKGFAIIELEGATITGELRKL
jgi:hypothetical protein